MDKDLFKKTEGKLYRYYEDLDKYKSIEAEIVLLKNIIVKLEDKIKKCDVNIDPEQRGIEISERVQTSANGISYVEREIEKAIDDMEKERAHRIKRLFKLECSARNMQYKTEKMKNNINMLNDEYKKFIELKYKEKMGMRAIALELNMSKNTAYDLRENIVNSISNLTCWI